VVEYVARQVGEDGRYTGQRDTFDCRDDGHAVVYARRFVGTRDVHIWCGEGLFSSWNAKADLEDARNVALDQATVAALQMHAPDMARRYVDDDLPEAFERLLDRAVAFAGSRDDAAFIDRYRAALAALLDSGPAAHFRLTP